MAVDMEVVGTSLQVHGEDQTKEPEIMITMQVTDEDVIDAMEVSLLLHQLHLCAFAAVNEKTTSLDLHQLCGSKTSIRRHGAA